MNYLINLTSQLISHCLTSEPDLPAINSLLDAGVDVNYRIDDYPLSHAPICCAIGKHHWPLAELLLSRGARITENMFPPFISQGDLEAVRFLAIHRTCPLGFAIGRAFSIASDPQVETKEKVHREVVHTLLDCINDKVNDIPDIDIFRGFISYYGFYLGERLPRFKDELRNIINEICLVDMLFQFYLVQPISPWGSKALIEASEQGDHERVRLLLQRPCIEVDYLYEFEEGMTYVYSPLGRALDWGHVGTARMLVNSGATKAISLMGGNLHTGCSYLALNVTEGEEDKIGSLIFLLQHSHLLIDATRTVRDCQGEWLDDVWGSVRNDGKNQLNLGIKYRIIALLLHYGTEPSSDIVSDQEFQAVRACYLRNEIKIDTPEESGDESSCSPDGFIESDDILFPPPYPRIYIEELD